MVVSKRIHIMASNPDTWLYGTFNLQTLLQHDLPASTRPCLLSSLRSLTCSCLRSTPHIPETWINILILRITLINNHSAYQHSSDYLIELYQQYFITFQMHTSLYNVYLYTCVFIHEYTYIKYIGSLLELYSSKQLISWGAFQYSCVLLYEM